MGGALCGQHHRASSPTRSRRKRGHQSQAVGRSRGGLTTKVHIKADGLGRPLAFVLTEGQRHDNQVFEELMEGGKVMRSSSGRPRVRSGCIVADRSYSNERIRSWLRRRKVRAVIPRTSRERKRRGRRPLDRALYKERNRIERLVARLKQFRRIATRYEKTAESYLGMLTLAAILVWL